MMLDMNRTFAVLISVTTFLLIVLIVILSNFRTQANENGSTDSVIAPTTTPLNRTGIASSVTPTPTSLNQLYKNDESYNPRDFVPYNSDALSLEYSPLSNQIYIEKKNEKAEGELQKILETRNVKALYTKFPQYFKIVKSNTSELVNEEDQVLSEQILEESSQTLPMGNQQKQNRLFSKLLNLVLVLDYKIPSPQPTSVSQQSSTSTPIATTQPTKVGTIGLYNFRVKYDWKEKINPICVLQPGTSSLVTYLKKSFGSVASFGISANCKNIPSMHSDGRAVDYFFTASNPEQLKRGNEVFAWLLTNAQNVGIQYIKFWRVHWSPGRGLHCVDNSISANDQYSHSNHIHFELNLAGAHKQTPFFTRGTSRPAEMVINQEICPLLDSRMRQ